MMKKKRLVVGISASLMLLGLVSAYLMGRARASGIPATMPMTYSATLTDASGTPLTGMKNLQVAFFKMATAMAGETPECVVALPGQMLVAGAFQAQLPDTCTDAVHRLQDLWIEVSVDGAPLPRTKIGAVPYAVEADRASCGAANMVDAGAGFCIDTADRTETAYGSSLTTCAGEGKSVCSFTQLCVAKIRNVGTLTTAQYRVSDLMYYPPNMHHYFGSNATDTTNPYNLNFPAACTGLSPPTANGGATVFRCCRTKG
jgi:hypothetical protein